MTSKVPTGEAYVTALEEIIYMVLIMGGSDRTSFLSPELRKLADLVIARRKSADAAQALLKAEMAFGGAITETPQAERQFPSVREWVALRPHMRVKLRNAFRNPFFMERTIIDLACMSEREFSELPSIGARAIREMREYLEEDGISFGMTRESAERAYRSIMDDLGGPAD